MAELVYISCALASMLCAILLIRSYRATRTPLLLWSSLCFVGLAVNNVLLFVDVVVAPSVDLSLYRSLAALAALLLLLFGLVWHVH
jgi:hypothetical protein